MDTMLEFFGEYLVPVLILIALAIALTIFVFRHRIFDRGYRKGEAANPTRVKRENQTESWRRST
jgi:hypothetical protein